VARRGQHLQDHLTQRQPLSVPKRLDPEVDLGGVAVGDDRAGARGQLQMTAQEVGVHVGLDDPLNGHAVGGRLVQVHPDVAPGIHHNSSARHLVAHQVGGVGQAGLVVLREDHSVPPADPGEPPAGTAEPS
jgi:hypothetical protein